MEMVEEDVVIVGAGIAGLATALALKKVGVRAVVLERSKGLRATGAALTLFPNAWLALDALGVAHKVASMSAPSQKGYITNVGTGTIQEFSVGANRSGNEARSVHRKALLEALAEELPMDTIRFSSKLTSIETPSQEGSSVAITHLEDGTIIKAKILIGCDGLHSVVAQYLGLTPPVNVGRWAVRGLAVFPEGHGLKQEAHHFLDVGKRGGFVPLTSKLLYWFFICKFSSEGEGMGGSDPELIKRAVIDNFAKDFPPSYLDIVHHSDLSTLTWAPLMIRFPWDVIFGNVSKGSITVAGDAMHPMTPDLGQGGCAALEDAVVLGRHIGALFSQSPTLSPPGPKEVARALEGYVKERRWRAAALITASFLSGWVNQDRSRWWTKLFSLILFGLVLNKLFSVIHYDCGKLPRVSSHKLDNKA